MEVAAALAGACGVLLARADSVVVFNEIMYHPAGRPEAAFEWVELSNQMAVAVDLSGWRLDGAIQFTFPEGTVIEPGSHRVVAASPDTLAAAGVPNALGPFLGRLDNAGDRLRLRNNNGRVMDDVRYGTDGDWPVAPDGAGPSLARRAPNLAGADPANWQASPEPGGSPGRANPSATAPIGVRHTPVVSDARWRYNNDGAFPGEAWHTTDFDDSAWPEAQAVFHHSDAALPGPLNSRLDPVRPTCFFRAPFRYDGDVTRTELRLRLLVDDGAVVYLNGDELVRVNLPAGSLTASTLAVAPVENAAWLDLGIAHPAALRPGTNQLAVAVCQSGRFAAYPQAVLASGPVGYWRLGEMVGPVRDFAAATGPPQAGSQPGEWSGAVEGNLGQPGPRPGDQVDGAALTGFEVGNAAPRFAGENEGGDDVVRIADPGVFNFAATRQFSLEAWVNASPAQEDGAPVVCKGTGGGGEQYCLDVVGGTYRFYVWTGGSPNTPAVAHSAVRPNGTWQHVVAVFDQPGRRMAVYVNGSEVVAAHPPATILDTPHEVSLGARQLSHGAYDLNFAGRLDEVAIYPRALPAAEIRAHFLAAFAASATDPDTQDFAFGLEVTAVESRPAVSLALNELGPVGVGDFWLEVANPDRVGADLGGCSLARLGEGADAEYVFPSGPIPAGGFVAVSAAELGFEIQAGDRLVLSAPGRSRVLDAVRVTGAGQARYPDGRGPWLTPSQPTPGTANVVGLRDELVINEIMYHPRGSEGAWLEILNRSSSPVDLAGWSIEDGVRYRFDRSRILAPGGLVVIAQSPLALQARHPAADIVGPFDQELGHATDRIVLRDPNGNPADTVRYFDGGHWPRFADGGGSSLELRDPRADNAVGEAWAASDESPKAEWREYRWRGVAQPGQPGEPDLWHEFALCLVDGAGEVLLDDISVIERPGAAPRELIQNGRFDGGSAAHWRWLGTHRHSRVEAEPGNPANFVLRLVATGAGEYQGNQIETTFTNNLAIVNGREYEIAFRARWVAGHRLLNARLYFNRLARTIALEVPIDNGTPGVRNSRALDNLGPTFRGLTHSPVVPALNQPVTVSVQATDPDGIGSIELRYSVAGGPWRALPMSPATDPDTPALWRGALPGQAPSSVIQFYVHATDARGASSTFPTGGPDSRALYVVDDRRATAGPLGNLRVIMVPSDAVWLHTGTNTLSNDPIPCTVVANEQEVFYDARVRLKGSFVGRNAARVGFHLDFNPDDLFRGVHDKAGVDRSQHTLTGGIAEILVKHLAGHAGGIPAMQDDLAWFLGPLPSHTGPCQLRLAGYDDLFLESQFERGDEGTMYEPEVIRWMIATVDGRPESPKRVGNEGEGTGYQPYDLKDYGDDPEAYRWTFPLLNNRATDDFEAAMRTARLFSLAGANLDTASKQVLDVDEWLRVLAFQTLVGPADAYYTGGTFHNYRLYARPTDGRVLYLPWDWDSAFMRSSTAPLVGDGNVARLVNLTANHRAYLNHLHDLIATAFNAAYVRPWATHYGTVAGQDLSGVTGYVEARARFVFDRLPTGVPFQITNHAGANFGVATGRVELGGTAPIGVSQLEINGVVAPVQWVSDTTWRVTVPLEAGPNSLEVRGLDYRGQALANASDTITVTNTGAAALLPIVINEWMADNRGPGGVPDPADGLFQDWIEFYNPNATSVALDGLYLTDDLRLPTRWQFPPGTAIAARGYLLVWADGDTHQNPALGRPDADLHAGFSLDADGEAIGLFANDARTPLATVTFGPQSPNVSTGCFPDGDPRGHHPMPQFTPRAANVLGAPPPPSLRAARPAAETLTLEWASLPGRAYRIEFKDRLEDPGWTALGQPVRPSASGATFSDRLDASRHRYYRVVLLE